ncbi:Putative oxidoreductase [Caulifigura coniformis]|uniref:Oxidoreductase n=1 Tax=Caulifigura coniformis TaxID=2527983 RepID=A0A517SF16_9PLAN|nr:NAD(P)/FAD-dependent oxidoreductase [Caulifigura coniformis]QDT54680.1 Putative oxidoreductase [Caulifigura coniformis]
MADFECAVIGAGLAGLSVALKLGRQGRRVLLVDRKASLSDGIHTTGIFVRRTLEDFDLPGDCLGPVIRHVSVYSPSLARFDLESPFAEFRVGRMGRLYTELLGQCRTAGVTTALDSSLESIVSHDGTSSLVLQTGLRRWKSDARLIVGADGAGSRVAEHLDLSRNSEWILGLEDVYRDTIATGPPRIHCLLDPELAPGYIAWAVHDGEELHLGVGGYAAQFKPAEALKRWTQVARTRLRLPQGERVERRGGRIPVGGVLPRIASQFGLLVGDAAGAVSPLTAGGLDPCLRLSEFAAEVLGATLQTGDTSLLEAYSGEAFRRKFRARLWLRAALRTVRSRRAINAAFWCLRTPIGRRLAGRIFFHPASFPDAPNLQPPLGRWSPHQA